MTVSSVSPVVAGCNGSESNGIMMFMFSVEYLVGKLNNDSYYYTHTLQQLFNIVISLTDHREIPGKCDDRNDKTSSNYFLSIMQEYNYNCTL